jgi:hypothetical protein
MLAYPLIVMVIAQAAAGTRWQRRQELAVSG